MERNTLTVLTVATDSQNKYVQEFEKSLKRLGYHYVILGQSTPWKGWITKIHLFHDALTSLDPDEIVILCDSYDILFLQGPQTILHKYQTLARNKVVIGLENITQFYCQTSAICDPNVLKVCNIDNKDFPNFVYPNSGFLMGPVHEMKNLFAFLQNGQFKDDQYGLFQWILTHCHKCYFDYGLDFVFNYISEQDMFIKEPVRVDYDTIDKQLTINHKSRPAVVHIPAHFIDLGERSETIRNFLFDYDRTPIKKTEYFKEFYQRLCKPEYSYLGYWWWVIIVVLLLMLALIVKNSLSR
jgi:hypothetical protein